MKACVTHGATRMDHAGLNNEPLRKVCEQTRNSTTNRKATGFLRVDDSEPTCGSAMNFIKRYRLLIVGLGLVVLVGGFLAFRPDKLFVDDTVDESLAEAFADAGDSDTPPPPTA